MKDAKRIAFCLIHTAFVVGLGGWILALLLGGGSAEWR